MLYEYMILLGDMSGADWSLLLVELLVKSLYNLNKQDNNSKPLVNSRMILVRKKTTENQ